MNRSARRGIALITVLLFSVIMLMMVIALYRAVHGDLFAGKELKDQTSALYLAEAGVMDAVAALEDDPDWTDGFVDKTVPGVVGSYTMEFNTSGAGFTPFQSVNNRDGTSDENFRGAGMVPAGYASVICTATVGQQKRTVEALVHIGGGAYPADGALVTSGKVHISGDVRIDGRKGIGENDRVDGDLHSNLNDTGDDLITWDGTGVGIFDGKVSSVGASAGAIDLSGATPTSGIQAGASARPAPDVNILGKIASKTGAPAPAISTGTTVLTPPAGGTALYHSGDLTVQGDLELQGVELYVDGTLTVNGSITGDGSVYVGGDTTFKGDARITAASPDRVSLFSDGNVQLSGFNGSEYMESLSGGDATLASAWNQLGDSIEDYLGELKGSPGFYPNSTIDQLSQEISAVPSGVIWNPVSQPGRQHDVTGTLLNRLAYQPNSSAKTFMTSKFQQLREIFFSYANGSSSEATALYWLNRGRLVTGAFDSAIDNGRNGHLPYMLSYVDNIDYNSLGSAYFQGLVFSHGSIYADSEITILGALVTKDNGTASPVTINGETLNPGDIILKDKTRVRYIEEFFKPDDDASGGTGAGADVVLWIGR